MQIEKVLNQFLNGKGKNKGKQPDERYASFDYCYNYFYSFYKQNKIADIASENNLQTSCLHLGFYLASWGMMRGSSFLLEKSSRHLAPLVREISKMGKIIWEIDVDNYNNENIEVLLECKNKIIKALGEKNTKTWDTLVTKIMLGVFANVPAYDTFFKKFLQKNKYCQTFNRKSLEQLKEFYGDNKKEFKAFEKIKTHNFITGKETDVYYTKAKLIDMYGFVFGQ